MEEESNGELTFLETVLKRDNGEISVLVYWKPRHTDQYLNYSSHHRTSCKESVFSSLFYRPYSIITNKDDLDKGDTRIKQLLNENGYQEIITSKIFKRITNNHSLPQLNQLRQTTEDKNNIVYKIDCGNCEAVYFCEFKRSLKSRSDEQNRSVRNCDCDKNEIAKHCWEADHNFTWYQKKVIDSETRFIPRKIKETIHALKNPNHIKTIS